MFRLKIESGTRRMYVTDGDILTAEVCTTEHTGIKGGAMDVYVKNGWVDHFMDKTLGVQTCFKLPDGTQVGELFNPTIKCVGSKREIDFDWLLEATPENEQRILDEIESRFRAWVDSINVGSDVDGCGA